MATMLMPSQHGLTGGITHSITTHGDIRDGRSACRGVHLTTTGEWVMDGTIHTITHIITHIIILTGIVHTTIHITMVEVTGAETIRKHQTDPTIRV